MGVQFSLSPHSGSLAMPVNLAGLALLPRSEFFIALEVK
jgi:hypothetical protein